MDLIESQPEFPPIEIEEQISEQENPIRTSTISQEAVHNHSTPAGSREHAPTTKNSNHHSRLRLSPHKNKSSTQRTKSFSTEIPATIPLQLGKLHFGRQNGRPVGIQTPTEEPEIQRRVEPIIQQRNLPTCHHGQDHLVPQKNRNTTGMT
jgi:hypothetical protein